MTLYQFNALDKDQQALIVWNGEFIDYRSDRVHNILLYQVESFYVEVFYDPVNNVVKKFRSFSSTDQLRPYLEKIDISEVL